MLNTETLILVSPVRCGNGYDIWIKTGIECRCYFQNVGIFYKYTRKIQEIQALRINYGYFWFENSNPLINQEYLKGLWPVKIVSSTKVVKIFERTMQS